MKQKYQIISFNKLNTLSPKVHLSIETVWEINNAFLLEKERGYKDFYSVVALDKNKLPVGWIHYNFVGKKCYIAWIYVLPENRKQGATKSLINYLKKHFSVIELDCFNDNKNALQTYKHLNFQIIKRSSSSTEFVWNKLKVGYGK